MTDQIDTLICELERAKGASCSTWLAVVRFAHEQDWYGDEQSDLNEYLVGRAFDLNEENILLAVALSLVPEGWFLWALRDSRTKIVYVGGQHEHCHWSAAVQYVDGGGRMQDAEASTPALALCIAALKAWRDAPQEGESRD